MFVMCLVISDLSGCLVVSEESTREKGNMKFC